MRMRSRHKHQMRQLHRHQQRKTLEEYLEILWYMQERHGTSLKKFMIDENFSWDPGIADELKSLGYIEQNEFELKFTANGYEKARQLVRSHRLAERLLTDVLNMKLDRAETGACEFEHIIVPEIVDGICTLLGHPKVCPHGLPIPEGSCCREAKRSIESVIKNITQLGIATKAKVAYINTRSNSRMHQLTQLGIHPGVEMWIHQKFPVLVLRINHTQIALDENVAKDILVWEQGASVNA
jgi:DtxR family Mn-dependent transcriptional regulator